MPQPVVQWLNSSGQQIRQDVGVQTNVRQGWTDYKSDANGSSLTAPSGAVAANVFWDIAGSNGNCTGTGDNFAIQRIKLEAGAVCTPFSNEQLSASVQQTAIAVASVQGYVSSFYGGTLTVANLVAKTINLASGAVTQTFSVGGSPGSTVAQVSNTNTATAAPTTSGGTGGGGAVGPTTGRGMVTP